VIYLDTTAIVKLLVEEEFSNAVRMAAEGQSVGTVSIAFVETLSALARKRELSEEERFSATREFMATWHRFRIVSTDAVLESAGILARAHQLRGLDAMHLAAARDLGKPSSIQFVVYDEELAKAAKKEGFQVITNPKFKLK
jgi:predicted nucleic acid-binding protein